MAFISFADITEGGTFVYENRIWEKSTIPNTLTNAYMVGTARDETQRCFDHAQLVRVLNEEELASFRAKERNEKLTKHSKIVSLDGHRRRTGVT